MRLRLALALLLVAGVIAGLTALYRSSLFSVDRVDVVGAGRLSAEEVRRLAEVPPDATLLRLPSEDIERRLRSNAWIAGVRVTRDFPHTVRIRVTERVPAAVLDLGGTKLFLVDGAGNVLAKGGVDASATLVVIRDTEGVQARPGRRVESEAVRNALRVLAGLSGTLRSRVRIISSPDVQRTALITRDDIEILVGPAENMARKDLVARRILKEQAGKVVYINVRTPDRPTWRGLD